MAKKIGGERSSLHGSPFRQHRPPRRRKGIGRLEDGRADTPLLLPPDLRDWVPANHLVHFIMDAVGLLDLRAARVNDRGTGDAQYPPAMMLGLP